MEAARLGSSKAAEALDKLPVKYALGWHEENAQKKGYNSAIRLAEYYVDKGDEDEARENFKIAIEANKDKVLKGMGKAEIFWRVLADDFQDTDSAMRLADAYGTADGVPSNPSEAVKWWIKAAQNGDAEAQFCLGCCYQAGKGVRSDEQEAVKWWRESAGQGDDVAINILNKLGIPME